MSATNADNAQAEVIAFLKDPASYPDRPESVDTVETHGAIVFMAGGRAYKMKRAVRLPYLDFSTLEKRRAVCRREIEINRPMAPRIYRDVVAITREIDGRLALGGNGEPVEYAVEMSRFDQSLLFDRMATRGALDRAIMARLADRIADSHATAPVHRNRGAQALGKVVAQVADAMSEGRDTLGDAAKDCARRLQDRFAEDRRRLEQRERDGFVRRCHGDLHLRNIVLLDGEPTLFDAIEFDEEIAIIDILYDFAFLLMDLWRRGHQHLANAVFNRYLWRGGTEPDIGALDLMPLFLALRAGVRVVVALDRMDQLEDQRRAAKRDEARAYFTLAGTFLSPPPPRLIAVGGLSGTGKSTLAAALAPSVGAAPGALHLRSDVERKLLFGRAPEDKLGEDAYSPQVTQRVYAQLAAKAEPALAAGHSVIVDAVHARAGEREAAEAIARRTGAPFEGLWLTAPEHVLIRRVDAREGDASDADAGVVRRQLAYEIGAMAWRRIDASGTPDEVAKAGLRALKESGAAG